MSDLKQRLLSYRPDRANGALLPAGLALLLAAGAALQLLLPQGAAVPPEVSAFRAPDRRLPAVSEIAAPDLSGRPSLFSPLRVIGSRMAELDTAGGMVAKPVGPLDGAFVLGSARVGRTRALLLREENGRVLRLAPGGSYRGWQLLRIGTDAAQLRKGGRAVRIPYGTEAPAIGSAEATSESSSE